MEQNNTNINISDYKELTPALRLNIVVLQYFGKQKNFADATDINYDMASKYISGYMKITKKAAVKMQDLAGINADFVLNGNLPMMLDETKSAKPYDVVYKANVPIIYPSSLQPLQKQYETSEISKGFVSLNVLETRGNRAFLTPQGKINIVDITINGIQEPSTVLVHDADFIERYKHTFPFKINCYIVLDKDYRLNDLVFLSVDEVFYLAVYEANNIFIDCATKKKIAIKTKNDIKIYGAWFSVINR